MKPNLVIGCGSRPKEDAVNLDMVKLPGVDVVHDLDVLPLPFPDNTFQHIEAEDVLEHVENFVGIMQELHRILKPRGTLWVRGPDGRYPEQLWRDPTHRRAFVPGTFDNYDPSTRDGKLYGHYFGAGKFHLLRETEKNKGMEYILQKI